MDLFSGTGTHPIVAHALGRWGVGCDIDRNMKEAGKCLYDYVIRGSFTDGPTQGDISKWQALKSSLDTGKKVEKGILDTVKHLPPDDQTKLLM